MKGFLNIFFIFQMILFAVQSPAAASPLCSEVFVGVNTRAMAWDLGRRLGGPLEPWQNFVQELTAKRSSQEMVEIQELLKLGRKAPVYELLFNSFSRKRLADIIETLNSLYKKYPAENFLEVQAMKVDSQEPRQYENPKDLQDFLVSSGDVALWRAIFERYSVEKQILKKLKASDVSDRVLVEALQRQAEHYQYLLANELAYNPVRLKRQLSHTLILVEMIYLGRALTGAEVRSLLHTYGLKSSSVYVRHLARATKEVTRVTTETVLTIAVISVLTVLIQTYIFKVEDPLVHYGSPQERLRIESDESY